MFKLIFLSTILLTVLADHYSFTESNHIITLGDPTWHIAEPEYNNALLVYYYEPSSIQCREFWPEYIQAAQTLFDDNSGVKLAKLDCHDEVVLCDKHNVAHFPTLLLHRQGKEPYEYTGGMNAGSLHEWVRKIVDFVYEAIDDEDTLFDRHSAAILMNRYRSEIHEVYKEYADEITIAAPSEDLQSRLGVSQTLIYTMNGDKMKIGDEAGAKQVKDLIENVLYVWKQAVPTYSGKAAKKLQAEGDQDLVLFFKTESVTPSTQSLKAFSQVASDLKNGNYKFYYVNVIDNRLGESMARLFGVNMREEPAVGILSKRNGTYIKYKLNDTADYEDNIKDFVQYFESGALQRYYMSAEIIEDEDQDVRELVGKNYDEVTQDPDLNVLVMLYFQWCDACVKVEPTWNSLAYRVRNMDNIVIARIDMSKNDLEGLGFTDYPVFLFYPAGEKKVIQYLEEPRMKYLQEFLEEYVPGLRRDIEL